MAKKLGNDYRLFIEAAGGGTYNEIKGQQDLSRSGSATFYDTSTKDTGAYATKAPAQREVALTLAMRPDLPDANGFTRLETIANAATSAPVNVQIRKAPFAVGDVVFQASMYVDLAWNAPHNNVVSATANFSLAAAPTVDALS
jgi:hypothetical protein